jgi:hypothetical protein
MTHKSIGRDVLRDQGEGAKFATINVFLDDSTKIDYGKDFWMPIEPWEYTVCSRGLSTQLSENGVDSGGSGTSGPSGIYDDAISIAAYQRYSTVNNTDLFFYEITWYFQPKTVGENTGFNYYVNVTGPGGNRVVQGKKGAGQRTGDSGYSAFYAKENYTQVIFYYDKASHKFPIIPVKDVNR